MAKRIRFTSPDGTYRSGDIAEFADHDEADRFIGRGSAVAHSGDGYAPDDNAASDFGSQPDGPVNAQGRVEAHEVRPGRSVVHTTEANEGEQDKGPVDKGTPLSQAEKAKTEASGPAKEPAPALAAK